MRKQLSLIMNKNIETNINLLTTLLKMKKNDSIDNAIRKLYKEMQDKGKEYMKMMMLLDKIELDIDDLEINIKTRNKILKDIQALRECIETAFKKKKTKRNVVISAMNDDNDEDNEPSLFAGEMNANN